MSLFTIELHLMQIIHKIDNFLLELFPKYAASNKNLEILKDELSNYYSFGPYRPKVTHKDDFVIIDIDTPTIAEQQVDFNKVVSLCEKGRYEEAKKILIPLIEKNPTNSEYHRVLGQILSDEGKQEEAINSLIDALKWNPKNGYALIMMGNIFARNKEDFETASKYYNQALVVNPTDYIAINNIGATLLQMGKTEAGIDYLEKAYSINPKYPNTSYGLSVAWEKLDYPLAAFDYAIKCMKVSANPNDNLYRLSYNSAATLAEELIKGEAGMRVVNEFKSYLEKETNKKIKIEENSSLPTLYLHASNTNSYYTSFVQSICEEAELLKGQNIFRCFDKINRIRLHNVGVRQPMGRAMSYIMRVGSDIKTALRDTEIKKAIKANIFGVGFENATRASIGCSHNGRIWSMRTNNILTWVTWCQSIGKKVTNPNIDPDVILKGTLLPRDIHSLPEIMLFAIEWADIIYRESIGNFYIQIGNEEYPIWNCDIELKGHDENKVFFDVILPSGRYAFELSLYYEEKSNRFDFTSKATLNLKEGNSKQNLCDFFNNYPPLMYFVDGAFLEGNLYTEIHKVIPEFTLDKFDLHDWTNVNIRKESQTFEKINDSIQYSILQRLIAEKKHSLLMDDDDSGEIADIVGFRVLEEQKELIIDLYHCKFSSENYPGLRVKDFYEVCGQAQRSIKWMENVEEIFKHLGRRSADRLRKKGVDRFEYGDEIVLDILKRRAKKDLKVRMNIFIVQPGLSFSDYKETSEISKLLAVVETYLKETWNAELKVIANE